MQNAIGENMESESKYPALGGPHRHTAVGTMPNQHWWPNQLNLKILHQNSLLSDPMGKDFKYAEEFGRLDLDALKKDIDELPPHPQSHLETPARNQISYQYQVAPCIVELIPDGGILRRCPKAYSEASPMCLIDDFSELLPFRGRHQTFAAPSKMLTPVVAD